MDLAVSVQPNVGKDVGRTGSPDGLTIVERRSFSLSQFAENYENVLNENRNLARRLSDSIHEGTIERTPSACKRWVWRRKGSAKSRNRTTTCAAQQSPGVGDSSERKVNEGRIWEKAPGKKAPGKRWDKMEIDESGIGT